MKLTIDIPREDYDALCDLSEKEKTNGLDYYKRLIANGSAPKTGHWVLSGGFWRCSECKEKALLKLDRATGGYREYEQIRSKYCPECGIEMSEVRK